MSTTKLYTDYGNPFSMKILAASYVSDFPLDVQTVQKSSFKLASCFSKQLPILEIAEGRFLFNPNDASCFIFNKSSKTSALSGKLKESVKELLEWESSTLQPIVLPLLAEALSDNTKEISMQEDLSTIFSTLDSFLGREQYLLGSSLTAADTTIWSSLYCVMQQPKVQETSSKFTTVLKWYEHLSSLEPFKKAVDKVTHGKGVAAFKDSLEGYTAPSLQQKRNQSTQKKPDKCDEQTKPLSEDREGPTEEEVKYSKSHWLKGRDGLPKPRIYKHPILPKTGERNILITAALPYVNNVPHLGNIIGCALSADVYARFCRLRTYNSLYICGTDEYGTATETKAIAEGLTPQQICDKYSIIHSAVYKWFNIDFDYFGRTTTKEQTKITQDIFWKVHKNGYLLEDTVDQLQCISCNRFLADRFVEGICPFCKYEDARGDQCDACGKLINAVELIKARCKLCGASPELKTSKHLFLNLPKIEPKLREWLKKCEEENWTSNARHITKAWLADGLKPRCITRDLKWGTSVPMEGYTDKVFYVWFDAPIGYLSITANYTEEWEKWWKNPDEVTLVQFMAKDNVPFHTVVFPSSLLAADDGYTMLNEISATEYLNYEDDKFSKSRGVGVFGDDANNTGIPADIFRFYLLYVRPESQDSAFQWSDLIQKNNSELLNNLGNFVNRTLMFIKNSFSSTMPELQLTEEDFKLIASVDKDLNAYVEHLDKIRLRDGLRFILNISRTGNQYIQTCKPWVLVKGNDDEKTRAGTVIGLAVNISSLLAVLIQPYMPLVSIELQNQLALPPDCVVIPDHFVPMLPTGHKIGVPSPLFQKIDSAVGDELKKRFSGTRANTDMSTVTEETKLNPPDNVNKGADSSEAAAELEVKVTKQGERKAKTVKHTFN